ncbi:DMT family transporter [Emticicia sp. TH156]|uniref:DMT family transporter n=1 Tax=Emticicia sp. TH156 TaxID=2067454 RepID=UPI000C7754B0|nr:DMT family transporter [Emticicia sp. TH156]PLK45235.1 EamA/RhaT family transporter [Emticicia sp. TH156]
MNTAVSATRRKSIVVWLLLCLLATMWGSSFLIMKKSLPAFTPVQIGALRIMSAGLVFLPLLIRHRKDYPAAKTKYFVLTGLLGYFFPAFLFALAGTRVNSSLVGALNSATPLFVLVVGALFFQQAIRVSQLAGLVLGFGGSLMLILSAGKDGLSFNNPYALLVIAASLMYGFNVNITGKHLNTINPVLLTGWTLIGVALLAGVILFSTDFIQKINQANIVPLLLIILLGVVNSGIATIIFNYILQAASPVFASSVTYLIPIVATIMGFLDGEPISLLHYSGMSIILVGVYLINKK